ncbi:PBECR4 domain-containing protein [Lactobacillus kefiranofaciens]|uniref:PBECR4 domain-containing protein n=1 Tax=Lactobacillus kefiranofaciens TaxID=267818 RepID=UPI002469BA3D|nr:PBECR4 domain-containing protein [Lactobacillus kefiranofaciens]MDH5101386.1 PBECR4 domain-containing protein [Lactobacillus kefiranofaciens]
MLNREKHLNYIKPSRRILINHPETYRLATPEEVSNINQYASTIRNVAIFYEESLSKSKIDYVYKEEGKILILPVKYKLENFPHLTGINFAFKSANEKFNYLKEGNNDTPIIIEKNNHTFEKLAVLCTMSNTRR